jgi:hypothetical protein
MSCIMEPRKSLMPPARESALISVKQQMAPPRSQLITANLSPGLMPALSLKSLGKTIWPRSSTLIKDSTLQQPDPWSLPSGDPIFLPTEIPPLLQIVNTKIDFNPSLTVGAYVRAGLKPAPTGYFYDSWCPCPSVLPFNKALKGGNK